MPVPGTKFLVAASSEFSEELRSNFGDFAFEALDVTSALSLAGANYDLDFWFFPFFCDEFPPLDIGDLMLFISDFERSLFKLDPANEELALFLSFGDGKLSLRDGTTL